MTITINYRVIISFETAASINWFQRHTFKLFFPHLTFEKFGCKGKEVLTAFRLLSKEILSCRSNVFLTL